MLNAWLAAEQQLYAYTDEPPAPLRADLVAGQTTTDLFPKLADYYVNPALQSEGIFLIKLKTQLLNGPTTLQPRESYRHCPNRDHCHRGVLHLGYRHHNGHRPTRPTHARRWRPVAARGTSDLELVAGSWKVASGQSTGVAKC